MPTIYENQHFIIHQSDECFIPGYLICVAKAKAPSLAELPLTAQQVLGPLLSNVTQAIQTVIKPERIYCMSFGELFHQLHFHLFPRTAWLAQQFVQAHPKHNNYINGPLMFNWAKDIFNQPIPKQPLQPALEQIKSLLV